MSALAHASAAAWAHAHRAVVLLLTVVLVAAAVTTAVLLLAGEPTDPAPATSSIPAHEDTCAGAPVGAAC